MDDQKIRLLIAEDHPIVRSGLVGIINAQKDMQVVSEAPDGTSAVTAFEAEHPDITLLDLQMPNLDGVSALEQIRSKAPEAKIIILTTYDTDDDIERALKAGAKAYLLKDVEPQDLIRCVRDVHIGKTSIAPSVAAKLASRLTRVQLSNRELEVLRLLAAGRSNKEIGTSLYIAESTVKLHVKTLFDKLGVTSRTEAMRAALERGLIRLGR